MKLSIFTDELALDTATSLTVLRDWGLKHVDFRGRTFGKACEALDADELQRLAELVAANGLSVACLQSSLAKVHLPDADRLAAEEAKFENILRAADALECRLVRAFFYWQPPKEKRGDLAVQPDQQQQVLDRMAPLARRAKEEGIVLAFENCGTTVDECYTVLDALGVAEWGLAWDCANEWLGGGEPPNDEQIAQRARRSRCIHVKARGIVPGLCETDVPWSRILSALSAARFEGPVSVETHNPDRNVSNADMSRRVVDQVRAAWPGGGLAAVAAPKAQADWEPVRFVVVGMGMGKGRSREILDTDGVELAGVVDLDEDKARAAGEEFGVEWTTTIDPWLSRDDVDAVFVVTPTGRHAEVGVPALNAGKHVITTKPMEASVAGCDALIDAARAAGRVLAVDFGVRVNPASQVIRQRVTRGDLGEILGGTMTLRIHRTMEYFQANGAWRGTWALDGGGAMSNQNIHHIDELICALGMPRRVCMHMRTQEHDIEAEDVACALWEYAGGALVTLYATTCYRPGGWYRQLELHGTEGAMTSMRGGPFATEIQHWYTDGAWETQPAEVDLLPWANNAQNFAAALRTGAELICTGEDGRRSRLVLDTMYESARADGVWRDVPVANDE